jgi:hypothetical protein
MHLFVMAGLDPATQGRCLKCLWLQHWVAGSLHNPGEHQSSLNTRFGCIESTMPMKGG